MTLGLCGASGARARTDLLDGAQLAEAGLTEERAEHAQRRLFGLGENACLTV